MFLSIYLFIYFWCPFFYFSYVFNMIHTSLHVQFSNIRTHSCLFLAASEYCELSLWLSPESCSVAELCLTLYDPMDSLSLGVCPSHVSWVDDAIQPPHPLPSSSFCLQSFPASGSFQWLGCWHQVAKVLAFQLQHQSFQWIFRADVL